MKNFNDSFTFDHTVCVVDNGDYGLAFHRFTGKVLAQYESRPDDRAAIAVLIDVQEYRRAYGEWPPNDTLSTAMDIGYWFRWADDAEDEKIRYDAPEQDFRRELLTTKLLDSLLPGSENWRSHGGLRDIEIRPWKCSAHGNLREIDECKPEDAEGWGLYGRTFAGPAWHMVDVASRDQAYWLRATLAPLMIVAPRLSDPYEAAWMRMEALDGVQFDPEGR